MGAWEYRKENPASERGLCLECGTKPQKSRGNGTYKSVCSGCDKKRHNLKRSPYVKGTRQIRKSTYRVHKKSYCEECGFIAVHYCQLDVDHIDGNHSNNSPDNLQTLCANCHRLKTFVQRNFG